MMLQHQDQLVLDQLFRLIQKENMTLEKIGGESELLFDSADLAGLDEKIWWTVNHIYKVSEDVILHHHFVSVLEEQRPILLVLLPQQHPQSLVLLLLFFQFSLRV